ncbi:MAG: hypothetical protein KJ709_06650 [Nanoarchaeota archaeon]|nr:hypothetical protein [Nanoarchaeota archaeon]
MSEYLDDAKEDFKRIDHLIYVTLKYSRTVDIFPNIFGRMISFYDHLIEGFLQKLKEQGKIFEIPPAPMLRCELLKNSFKDDLEMFKHLDLYILLRKLSKSTYTRSNEFRRHVTMTATLDDGQIVKVDIDLIHGYYTMLKEFLTHVESILDD